MKKQFIIATTIAAEVVFMFSYAPLIARAETILSDVEISENTVWTREGSPYVINEGIYIPSNVELTIEDGVEVTSPPLADPEYEPWQSFYVEGELVVKGKEDSKVKFNNLSDISIEGGRLELSHAEVDLLYGITVDAGVADIDNSTLRGSEDSALLVKESTVNIRDTRIVENENGIKIWKYKPPFLVSRDIGFGLADLSSSMPSSVKIENSAFVDNEEFAFINQDENSEAIAENNWWGSEDGPEGLDINGIDGEVEYDPWLTYDPTEKIVNECCSNVLFIPGLQSTRLYKDQDGMFMGTSTNTLWEPNRNDDVRKLFLNGDGQSLDSSIYSGEPIDRGLGVFGIYDDFMELLDELVETGDIKEWRSFGYDWRKSIPEVVAGPEKKATTSEYLVDVAHDLAMRSPTGKVTVIAHSNGGLVAKYLVKTLTDLGKENIVDKVVSVAVPYVGTPKAILGLLHGDGQERLKGILIKSSVARELGKNMPSAYSLLPSEEYFKKAFLPSIAFAATTTAGINSGSYPTEIMDSGDQADFILDNLGDRTVPEIEDTSQPIIANKNLLIASKVLHSVLDTFVWPTSISRWALVGWNKATSMGIRYFDKEECDTTLFSKKCEVKLGRESANTSNGDGTVALDSATYESGEEVYLDLEEVTKEEGNDIAHANILENNASKEVVKDIIKTSKKLTCNDLDLPSGASCNHPVIDNEVTYIVLSTHSPVRPHLYDEHGRHTGEIPLNVPDELDVEEGLYIAYEEKIPGSSYEVMGDGDDTYIRIRDDGKSYKVVLEGTDMGVFRFDIDRKRGVENLEHVEYRNIPVTPLTIASANVSIPAYDESTATLASSSPVLEIDLDGNGTYELNAKPNIKIDPNVSLDAYKKAIVGILGDNSKSRNIIKRIEKIQELVAKGKYERAVKKSDKLEKKMEKMGHKKLNKLSDEDRQMLAELIEYFITGLE